jgi:hypothetical protein
LDIESANFIAGDLNTIACTATATDFAELFRKTAIEGGAIHDMLPTHKSWRQSKLQGCQQANNQAKRRAQRAH